MLFNSFEFAIFFPIVTILFFLTPHKLRWLLLLLSSCVFYMYFKPVYILILAFIIAIDYIVAIQIEKQTTQKRKRLLLIFSLIANLGVLFIFKYFNFFATNFNSLLSAFHTGKQISIIELLLPIGLSFHTLQAMSYTIEVSRGKVKAEKHLGIYALYVMFYPQLVAGPIERPQNLIPQFHQRQYFSYENARRGLILIAWGLFKKMVIADRLAGFVNQVHAMPNGYYTGIPLIISAYAFIFQIYCDFSGYSDIATGCAKFMGFTLMPNFKAPFTQKNIALLWANYHISLTSWLRDYAYMPIRKHIFPNIGMWFSVFLVMILSGIWHGANWQFIIWGAANALVLVVYNNLKRKAFFQKLTAPLNNTISNLLTLTFFALPGIFFRSSSVTVAITMFKNLFKDIIPQIRLIAKNTHSERLNLLYLKQSSFDFFAAIFLLIGLMFIERKFATENVDGWLIKQNKTFRWIFYYSIITIFILIGIFKKTEFFYFQF